MLSFGDYPAALEAIFSLYEVDQVKCFGTHDAETKKENYGNSFKIKRTLS